jgi:hypothetical protein
MDEPFYLPDRVRDLATVEARLREECSRREEDYRLVRRNLPAGSKPRQTPAYFDWLVAHRKWQFAYEKLTNLRRPSGASAR